VVGLSDDVLALRYGTRETTRREVFVDPGEDGPIVMDYFFWVIRGPERTIVVDTGFDVEVGARRGRTCTIPPLEALARAGVEPAAVDTLILTHLHYDHTGHVQAFEHADVIVPGVELDAPAEPFEPEEVERVRAVPKLRRVESSGEVAPGVYAHLVGGHSPGQLVLELDDVVLASDAIHYYEELDGGRDFAILVDADALHRGYDLLRRLGRDKPVVAGHDPAVLDRFANDGVVVRCA
jgi:glyoxylase-like metal-dependent hydrolase (beta-lactamase superfamily II)